MALTRNWRRSLEAICIPIGAIVVSLIGFGLFCALVGANPLGVYGTIWKAAFGRSTSIQSTLLRASPLMLSALCTALPARLGLVVIGNEGAIVIGGLGSVAAGLGVAGAVGDEGSSVLVQLAMAMASLVAGGIWIGIVGILRHYRGVNETISSLLMNYIAIAFLNHMVEGPMRDPSSLNKPSSFPIPDVHMLGTLPGTRVHYGLIFGLIACIVAYILIQRTTYGFAARTAGGNIRAARIAGLPVGQLTVSICALAGSFAGLAGMVEVAAVHGRANESLNANYGYSGILVAFIARHNPLAAILVSVLLGGILASGGLLQRAHDLPDATVLVFQGLVFLVVLFSDSLYGRLAIFQEPDPVSAPSVSGSEATV